VKRDARVGLGSGRRVVRPSYGRRSAGAASARLRAVGAKTLSHLLSSHTE